MLDTSGDGTADFDQHDGTVATTYKMTVPAGKIYFIERVNLYMEDNTKFIANGYGGGGVLVGGIYFDIVDADGGTLLDINSFHPITRNGHWALLAGVDYEPTAFATGNDMALVRWTLSRAAGGAIRINAGESFRMVVNTALSTAGLVEHHAMVQCKVQTA